MQQRDDWRLTGMVEHETGRGDPFAAAVRATRMPMVITDPQQPDNPIVFCNEAFQTLTGYPRDEIVGRNCRFLQGPDTDPGEVARVREAIETGHDASARLLNYRKDGTTFWNALYVSPVHNHEGRIEFFFASQVDLTERVEAEATLAREVGRRTAELEDALAARTLLLHEVDHRVKNNLTMIGALLRLQARTIGDPAVATRLEAMLGRVDALATVHRRLYQSADVTRFDAGALAANLAADLIGASGRDDIALRSDVDRVEISSAKASALGLVLNELLTNAIRHGFADDRGGTLSVSVRRDGERAEFVVADDGVGFGGGDGAEDDGLGRMLVKRLSRQLGAAVDWSDGRPGTQVRIAFPVET